MERDLCNQQVQKLIVRNFSALSSEDANGTEHEGVSLISVYGVSWPRSLDAAVGANYFRMSSWAKWTAMRPSGSVELAFNRRVPLWERLFVCWRGCHGAPCKATHAA
jgi:hypothetical protein